MTGSLIAKKVEATGWVPIKDLRDFTDGIGVLSGTGDIETMPLPLCKQVASPAVSEDSKPGFVRLVHDTVQCIISKVYDIRDTYT